MTDTFAVQGDLSPVQSFDTATGADSFADAARQDLPAAPNGFLKFGLAAELVRAVEDLGFTQPTPVQDETIPLAMQGVIFAVAMLVEHFLTVWNPYAVL